MSKNKVKEKLKSLAILSLTGTAAFTAICIYKGNEKFYRNIAMPAVRLLDPETAHKFAIFASKYRLLPKSKFVDPEILKIELLGKKFSNPVGIAAGFDKDGEAILGLQDIGFGFIEIGSVTPKPQEGNEKPRVFRLEKDLAVINRYGFNSKGHDSVLARLQELRTKKQFNGILGVNLGSNKTTVNQIEDYREGVRKLGPFADYLVINISSPNTPGLRKLQGKNELKDLLRIVTEERNKLSKERQPPIFIKLAPDLTYDELKNISKVVKGVDCKIDGFIVSNTTVQRPESLTDENKREIGGLSGKPLKDKSTKMIADLYTLTEGKIPIIGVGGISSGLDAYEKIKAGASAVQLYSALVYDGPPVVTKIKRELAELLEKDSCLNIASCIGKESKYK